MREKRDEPPLRALSVISSRIYLELSQGETTAGTDTAVVLDGRASHNGTQLVNRAGSNGSSLSETVLTTTVLTAGLESQKIHVSRA